MVKKVPDFQREGRIAGDVVQEVGSPVGAAEKASCLVVGLSSFLSRVEGSEPHSDLLRCVLDLSHPFSGGPLSHPDELVLVGAGSASRLVRGTGAGTVAAIGC